MAHSITVDKVLGAPPKFITSPSGYTSWSAHRKRLEIFMLAVNVKVNNRS